MQSFSLYRQGKPLLSAVQFHKKLLLDGPMFFPYNSKRRRGCQGRKNRTAFHIFFTAQAIHFHI